MNHEMIAKRFKEGSTSATGCNMFINDDCLYSYGYHFILAKRKGGLFLLNGDKYSVSTSSHQSITRQELGYGSPTTSFQALANAGIHLDNLEIIDFSQDFSDTFTFKYASKELEKAFKSSYDEFKQTIPIGATIFYSRDKNTNELIEVSYHLAGSILIKHNEKYYICGMDDNSYFVSELPRPINNVENAYQMLKPDEVAYHEDVFPDDVIQRQGEWFFLPIDIDIKKSLFQKRVTLPNTDNQTNDHIVTNYYKPEKYIYCFGTIRHSQHKMIKLGNVIHRAVCNTAVNNWSVSGVD